MAYTWEDLKADILFKLSDPAGAKFDDDDQLLSFANSAIRAFASTHTPYVLTSTITADSSTREFAVPDDFINVVGLYREKHRISRVPFITDLRDDQAYCTRSDGYIEYINAPTEDHTLYYGAYYPVLAELTDDVLVPQWAYEALSFRSAAAGLSSKFVKMLDLRNWNQRIDQGQPEDTPTGVIINHYMKQYYDILKVHTPLQYQELDY